MPQWAEGEQVELRDISLCLWPVLHFLQILSTLSFGEAAGHPTFRSALLNTPAFDQHHRLAGAPLTEKKFPSLAITPSSAIINMGNFLNRKPVPAPDANHHTHSDLHSASSRPSVGQWFKATWLDILTMASLGAVGLGVRTLLWAPAELLTFGSSY